MTSSTHAFTPDPRNAVVLVSINGELVPRAAARVSLFDAGYVLGDGVWEGLRLVNGRIALLDRHLKRLYEGAKTIDLDIGLSPAQMSERLQALVAANRMTDGVHIRLMVTRGVKATPHQDPRFTISPATIAIVAEWKNPAETVKRRGIRLASVAVRRGAPDVQDPGLNSHSKLNCIAACIQASKAGADEALMLDPHGFVATCNSTHFFVVRGAALWTSTGRYCLKGITRGLVLELARRFGMTAEERDFTLAEAYGADEAFVTGTFGGLTPVIEIDGRRIGEGRPGPITARLAEWHARAIAEDCGQAA
ncbi:MAG: aminotransferase class IV [Alphaproteobacteria bacterium]|nr:aminotransferase class IV [Alphaproteobacteria bacterium]